MSVARELISLGGNLSEREFVVS